MNTSTTPLTPNTFLQRVIGAASLDTAIYEEVEADPSATGQAMAVVVLSSLAVGFGARGFDSSAWSIGFFGIIALLSWASWALVMFQIGSKLLPDPDTKTSPGELLRTLGFAATPGFMAVLGAVPGVSVRVFAVVWVWTLLTMVVAVRQALDYRSTAKAVAVCLLGGVLAAILAVVIGMMFGPTVS
jgi:hypothetical protein